MINKTEAEEQQYLSHIIDRLDVACVAVDENVARTFKELNEQKAYLYEHKTGMDAAEKASVKQAVNMQAISGEAVVAYKERLRKLMKSPYFGRFDFRQNDQKKASPIYVGIHSYFDEEENKTLIHDWRAPVSGMFYDFEPGDAYFNSPSGTKTGVIERKRQYRIKDGIMEMMLESDLYIRDEVLQKELSRSADDKMKNIVATIQRDQNAIIRNETSPVLIIQGVAGSGKTSIALHRIAFLLYRYKETLTSRDIMIISPNKVFSDYISNVLPELGEENIPEMEMEQLAERILAKKFRFKGFFDQVNRLLERHEPDFIERIAFKSTSEFLDKLASYTDWLKRDRLVEHDIAVRFKVIPGRYLRERFHAHTHLPLLRRHQAIATDVLNMVKRNFGYDLRAGEKKDIRTAVKKMMGSDNLRILYQEFYDWLDRPDMFRYASGSTYEYADLFPLLYLKMQLEGAESYQQVKHLIVDEMQDYSAVQYAVLARLFPCNKTILGDANQHVNPYSSTTSADIAGVFPGSESVSLNKSYRSTLEITNFTLRISPRVDVETVERYGEEPEILSFGNTADENRAILGKVRAFLASDYHTLGILCKTQKQASVLHSYLERHGISAHLLTPGSSTLNAGVLIASAHLAKGLEFDQVIVPHTDEQNYKTDVDRSMLYIACTRAMHRLTLTHTGKRTGLICD
ncbi:MAG: helicase [Balneolaceae bacterium]|nr:MAG: helicase [Balneolaceae bacterium]